MYQSNVLTNVLTNDLSYILENTNGLWDEIKGERIFITGGTGFIGCWLLESLLWANAYLNLNVSIVVLTRNVDLFRIKAPHLAGNPAITFQVGDITDYRYPKGNFSYVIHAAAETRTDTTQSDQEKVISTIVKGAEHTLNFAVKCGAKKILFTSSGAVYGNQPSDLKLIPESYTDNLVIERLPDAYGRGKLLAEKLFIEYADKFNLEAKIARCFAFVGPYLPLNKQFAIGNFILNGLKGESIHIKGDGTTYRSYLYAADLVIWLWHILFRGQSCQPYNVGSDQEISIRDLAYLVAQHFDPVSEVIIDKKTIIGQVPERYLPSVQKVRDDLGLNCQIDLNDAIEKTIRRYC